MEKVSSINSKTRPGAIKTKPRKKTEKIYGKLPEIKQDKKLNLINKQKENELKQKAFSQKLKQKKEADKKHSDTFGDFIYDEYDQYADKFET
jgi:hypothetical protein